MYFRKLVVMVCAVLFCVVPVESKSKKKKNSRGYILSSRGRASWHNYDGERKRSYYYRYGTHITASRRFPCGTKIKVFNRANKKWVKVTVADWGPAAWTSRQLDLSKHAFRKIANINSGQINVTYIVTKIGNCRMHRH